MRFLTVFVALILACGSLAQAESPPHLAPKLSIEAGSHISAVRRVSVSADGMTLVTGSDDKTVRVWNAQDGSLEAVLRVPTGDGDDGKIFAVAISPDGKTVAAGGWDHTDGSQLLFHVYVFDRATGQITARLGPVANAVNDLAFSSDGALLAAGFAAGGLTVWQGPHWALVGSDSDYAGAVHSLAFLPDGGLAVAALDGDLRVYDQDFTMVAREPAPSGSEPDSLAVAPDGQTLAVGYAGVAAVDLLTLPGLQPAGAADVAGLAGGDLGAVAWSADGETLYAGGSYNTPEERMPLFAWSQRGKGQRVAYDAAGDTIMDVAALPGGGVAVAGADHTLTVFNSNGALRFRNGPVAADMRGKLGDDFTVNDDATQVRFGLGVAGRDPWLFDVTRLTFTPAPAQRDDFHAAPLDSLALSDWNSTDQPLLNGRPLQLDHSETSRSAVTAPDGSWLALGTDYALRRFSQNGQLEWSQTIPEVAWGLNIDRQAKLIVAAHLDGTLRWYRASDGQPLLTVFVHAKDKRWVAWTPKGYFAASPGGETLMGWQVNHGWTTAPDLIPCAQLHDRFYRPDIVSSILAIGDEAKAIRQANEMAKRPPDTRTAANSLPPSITITDPVSGGSFAGPSVVLHYALRTADDRPVTGIDVLIDGRPQAARGVVEAPPDSGAGEIEVALPPRTVAVSLVARNADGASTPATVTLTYSGALTAAHKGKLYAVLAGVSDYDDQALRLQFADDDANGIGAALQRLGDGTYAAIETKVLTDKQASGDNIRAALAWLAEKTTAEDTGILFLAGHGVTDPRERFYYLPVGGAPKPQEQLEATAISDAEIQTAIQQIAGKVIFFIDACHSAAGLTVDRAEADVTGVINRLARADTGVIMFASSTGREVSFESSDWGHGAFTTALLEGLSGKADYQKDSRITVAELNLWLSTRVAELTNQRQNAVMVKPDTIKDFALADVVP